MSTSIIQLAALTRHYGRRVGIEDLTFTVGAGSLFGFLGPNGAGKTTTIRVLLGLLKPTSGSASVFGMDTHRASHRIKSDLGYLPGDLRLYPWLTLGTGLRIFGAARRRDLSKVGRELAETFELDGDVPVRRMSRGMKQKLGLILALAHQPGLLVLDEPTTALDPIMQERLYAVLREAAANGTTVFFSSHTLSEVERLCDRVAILRQGRLVAHEALDDLRARAERVITIVWHDEPSARKAAPPRFLTLDRREGRAWHASLSGPADELIRWCNDKPIADISIGQPELGVIFQRYYQEDAES